MTLRRDASDVEKAALDEGSPATRGSWRITVNGKQRHRRLLTVRHSWLHWRSTEADREELSWGIHKRFAAFLEKSGPISLWLRVTIWNPKQFAKPCKLTNGTCGNGNERRGCPLQDNSQTLRDSPRRDLELSETTHKQERHTWRMGLKVKLVSIGQLTNTRDAILQKFSNKWKDKTTLILLRLPVSQRQS